jgi:hypothetical protein
MRRNEVLGLRWSEVDRERGLLELGQTKTGRSVRPLSPEALAVLTGCPRVVGSPYVFPSPRDPRRPLAGLARLWDAVRHAAGLAGADGAPVRLHDLRHTAASMMLQGGASLAEVGRALGHASSAATARYAFISDAGAQRAAAVLGAAVTAAAADLGAGPAAPRALPVKRTATGGRARAARRSQPAERARSSARIVAEPRAARAYGCNRSPFACRRGSALLLGLTWEGAADERAAVPP